MCLVAVFGNITRGCTKADERRKGSQNYILRLSEISSPKGGVDNAVNKGSRRSPRGDTLQVDRRVRMCVNRGWERSESRGGLGTALSAAAYLGNLETVQILLAKGAHVDGDGELGTPLQFAVRANQKEIVELLLKSTETARNWMRVSNTPLQLATLIFFPASAHYLLHSTEAVGKFGRMPIFSRAEIIPLTCVVRPMFNPASEDNLLNLGLIPKVQYIIPGVAKGGIPGDIGLTRVL
ncbi:hypothetical protein DFH08DRAFT_809356 [Mycena albidolilacea]|uniref:Uncharacterized protein n=1 Tax=Mycena albidolilacea TaxID=1033008 RepID=A0AAD7ERM0_9AGAR|nr:hypothetical protein DFH08DRAFT_809356 [Mycena albidolilacea]